MNSYNGDDAKRAASFYANDAFVFVPGQPSVRGRDAIAANIARYMQDPHFALGYTNELTTVSASGDLAVHPRQAQRDLYRPADEDRAHDQQQLSSRHAAAKLRMASGRGYFLLGKGYVRFPPELH